MKLILPFPPSTNTCYAVFRGRKILSKKGREYKATVAREVLAQRANVHLRSELAVTINFYRPDRRIRDIANYEKSLIDALVDAGVMEDDSQIGEMHIYRQQVSPPGRAEVIITPRYASQAADSGLGYSESDQKSVEIIGAKDTH